MKKTPTPNTLCHSTASLKGKCVACDAVRVRRAVWSESECEIVGELVFFSIWIFGFVFVSLKDLIHFRERILKYQRQVGQAARKQPVVKNYIFGFIINPNLLLIHKKIVFLS